MARTMYVDREGTPISMANWKVKCADLVYKTVEQYDNGVVQVTLQWSGRVTNPDIFEEYWPVYILLVKNYRADGALIPDPVDNDVTYPSEETARKGYQKFLAKWTACEVDSEGDFTEADNALTPIKPPPPDLNRPTAESEELGDAGAW